MEPNAGKLGRYTLCRLLARGGMGEIYLAQLQGVAGFEKKCVIKKIRAELSRDPSFVERFLNEGRTLVALTHSNIVQIFDMGECGGEYYMAMEYVSGCDLRELLKRGAAGKVPREIAISVCLEVLKGLGYAHRATDEAGQAIGIVHRDVSTSNILISDEGEVKLIDFGIAKAKTNESYSGIVQGKFAYMSPEQARGEHLDARTDLFSLGVVLYEMLSGIRPFEGNSDLQSLERVKFDVPRPLSEFREDVDDGLNAIVERALSKDKEERFEDAETFYDALYDYAKAEGLQAGQREVISFFKPYMSEPNVVPCGASGMDAALDAMLNAQALACQSTVTRTVSPVKCLSTGNRAEAFAAAGFENAEGEASGRHSSSLHGRVSRDSDGLPEMGDESYAAGMSSGRNGCVSRVDEEGLVREAQSVSVEMQKAERRRNFWMKVRAGVFGGLVVLVLLTLWWIHKFDIDTPERAAYVRTSLRELEQSSEPNNKLPDVLAEANYMSTLSEGVMRGLPFLFRTGPEEATIYVVEGEYRKLDGKQVNLLPSHDVEIAIQAPGYETCLFLVQFSQSEGEDDHGMKWRNCAGVSTRFSVQEQRVEVDVRLKSIRAQEFDGTIDLEPKKGVEAAGGQAEAAEQTEASEDAEGGAVGVNAAVQEGKEKPESAAQIPEKKEKKAEKEAEKKGVKESEKRAVKEPEKKAEASAIHASVTANVAGAVKVQGERYELPAQIDVAPGTSVEVVPKVTGRRKGISWHGKVTGETVDVSFCEASVRINESYVAGDPAPYQISDIYLNGELVVKQADSAQFVLPCGTYELDAKIHAGESELKAHRTLNVVSGGGNSVSLTLYE